jgi:hypothetical protein
LGHWLPAPSRWFLRSFGLDGLLIEILRFFRVAGFFELVFDCFENGGSEVLSIRLYGICSDFSSDGADKRNGGCSDIVALVVSIFDCILDDILVVFAKLEFLHYFA